MRLPNKLSGTHPLVDWLNQFLEASKSTKLLPGVGYRIKSQSSDGTVLEIDKQAGGGSGVRYFPFKIYKSPTDPGLDAAGHLDKDWRTFRVRAGLVGLTEVDFTDGVDNPDTSEIPNFDTDIDFVLASGQPQIFVWIDAVGEPFEIHMETTAQDWEDGQHILLGWVDTTNTTDKIATVRQLVRADLPEYAELTVCKDGTEETWRLPARKVEA